MSIEIRKLSEDDLDQAVHVWNVSFGDSTEYIVWALQHYFPVQDAVGLFEQENLVSVYFTRLCKIALNGRPYEVDMVAGVATLPECRSKGYSSRLMRYHLKDAYHRGEPFTILNTYIHDYYKKFGYYEFSPMYEYLLHATHKNEYEISCTDQYGEQDLDELCGCYRRFMENMDNYIIRDKAAFRLRLDDSLLFGAKLLICRNHEKDIVGYMLLDPKNSRAIETVYCDEKALGLLAYEAEEISGKEISCQFPEYFEDNMKDLQFKKIKKGNGAMLRVIDAEAFMNSQQAVFLDMEFGLKDPVIAGNNRNFKLIRQEEGSVLKRVSHPVNRQMDIGLLPSLVLGIEDEISAEIKGNKNSYCIFDEY